MGLILVHHTNKPLRGKEKDSWAAGDYAYLGAGSAEWINPTRAALAIRSPDLACDIPGLHIEVKRSERLRLYEALAQAERDASLTQTPLVMHRANRKPLIPSFSNMPQYKQDHRLIQDASFCIISECQLSP